jgi:hypothetical protein
MSVMLGRQKYIQLNHQYVVPVALGLKLLLRRWKSVVLKFRQNRGEILLSAIHKLSNCIWNREELLDQWKESIIIAIHKKGVPILTNKYHGIPSLSTLKKMLSNILLSRSTYYWGSSLWVSM